MPYRLGESGRVSASALLAQDCGARRRCRRLAVVATGSGSGPAGRCRNILALVTPGHGGGGGVAGLPRGAGYWDGVGQVTGLAAAHTRCYWARGGGRQRLAVGSTAQFRSLPGTNEGPGT